tara:strand:- start:568 stop:1257 length:690 start_codon:yes stop_codon:yes gene_type:complete
MSSSNPASGLVVPHTLSVSGRLLAAVGFIFLRALSSTLRLHLENRDEILQSVGERKVIFALWHNRLALSLPICRNIFLATQPHRRMVALISASRDGAILSKLMEYYGVQPVRGSSSRRGEQALRELVSYTKKGYDATITPDGPRGPKYQVQEGVVMLSQLTGMPILPLSVRIHPKKVLGSWDAFQLPMPFARCDVRVGQPIDVAREASPEEREAKRLLIEKSLMELTTD